MAEGKFVAYFRVSTARQGRSGLGLEPQQQAVRSYLNGGPWELVAEVVEVESGTKSDRPKLMEALQLCRIHRATLVIAKLDRLARNVAFISNLMESRVEFVAVDFPSANRLTVHVLSAVAEHEARMISERTKAALGAAKLRGAKLGGDRGNLPLVSKRGAAASATIRRDLSRERAKDLASVFRPMLSDGLSLRAIAKHLNQNSIQAPRGGRWCAVQVSRVVEHLVKME